MTQAAAIVRHGVTPRMSQAVVHGDTIYLAGQVALDAMGASVAEQTRAILDRSDLLLAEAGSSKHHLLSATILLVDIAGFEAMNAVWDEWIPAGAAPARATFEARLASPGFAVEIVFIAARPT